MLPGRPPVRRLGAASLALSAGALLVFAAPAPAAAAAPKKCVKGHDPETSIADIKCQFDNNVEAIKKKLDEINGKNQQQENTDKEPKDIQGTKKPDKSVKKPKPRKTVRNTPAAPQTSVRAPSNFTVQPPRDLAPEAPRESVSDALPEQPQVAEAPTPQSSPPVLALPETRMVEPVAAAEPIEADTERALWAAGGAAAATAVVMGQFSLIGARLRRRALQARR